MLLRTRKRLLLGLLVRFVHEAVVNPYSFLCNIVAANLAKLFSNIYQQLLHLFRYRKDIQKEMLANITTELKYQKIISPLEHTQIIEGFDKGNRDLLVLHATTIADKIQMTKEDKTKLLSLIETKNVIEGFRFLHLVTLLKKISAHDNWEMVLTHTTEQQFKEASTLFSQGGSVEPLHALIYNIYSRLHIYEWLGKIQPRSTYGRIYYALINALLANNPTLFAEQAAAFFANILEVRATDRYSLCTSQLEELSHFFQNARDNSDSSLFTTFALELEQKEYFNQWNTRAKELHTLLKTATMNDEISYDMARVDDMIEKSVELWELYGKIFEGDSKGHICHTYYAAQYGECVATWRKINKQFTKLARLLDKTPQPHIQCNCHYAKKLTTAACSKWHGLPDRIHKIRSLNHTPLSLQKKEATMLGLFCTLGSGHRTALDAVISYSQQEIPENGYAYHVRTLNVPLDVLFSQDPIHNTIGKAFDFANGDWLYNFLLQKDRCDIIQWLRDNAGGAVTQECATQIKKLLRDHILKENPDLIVTTYSLHYEYIEEVAEELGIPLLHVATDFDLSGRKASPTHPAFAMAIPANHPKMIASLGEDKIKEEQIAVTGPIVRPPFQKKSEEEILELRQQMGIADREHVIVVSSGGSGVPSRLPELLAQQWNNTEMPLRIIVLPGKNSSYASHLRDTIVPAISHPECVRIDVHTTFIEDPSSMANLYHVASLVHGKPGGLTSNEVAATGTQFLGDQLRYRFSWEYFNNDILIDVDLGDKISSQDSDEQIMEKIANLLKKKKTFPALFHSDTTPAQNYGTLMTRLIKEGKNNERLQQNREGWNAHEADLTTYISSRRSTTLAR